jgi:hypothetical protein
MVERFCQRVIYLDHGGVVMEGNAHDVCKLYELHSMTSEQAMLTRQLEAEATRRTADHVRAAPRGGATTAAADARDYGIPLSLGTAESVEVGTGEVRITSFDVLDEAGTSVRVLNVGRAYRFRLTLDSDIERDDVGVSIQLISEDARTAFSVSSYAYITDDGREGSIAVSISKGPRVIELVVSRLFLGAGNYFVTAGVSPGRHTNTYAEFFDLKWKRWALAVQRLDFSQNVVFEQPVSWRS